jgi:serine/threonine-protein kinase HipA
MPCLREDINRKDLLAVARQMNIKKAENIILEVQATINDWSLYAKKANVKDDLIRAIAGTLLVV